MEEGDGKKRAVGEHEKDKGHDIWRGADDKNVGAVKERLERIQCGVQDVKGGVIRDVRV